MLPCLSRALPRCAMVTSSKESWRLLSINHKMSCPEPSEPETTQGQHPDICLHHRGTAKDGWPTLRFLLAVRGHVVLTHSTQSTILAETSWK